MVTAIRSFLFLLAPVIAYAGAGIVFLRPLYTPETALLNPGRTSGGSLRKVKT